MLREAPLLVLDAALEAPALLGCPVSWLGEGGEPAANARDVLADAEVRMASEYRRLHPPTIVVRYRVLAQALRREIDQDAGSPADAARAVAASEGDDAAKDYEQLLAAIAKTRPVRRVSQAEVALSMVGSRDGFSRAVVEFPELLSQAVRDNAELQLAQVTETGTDADVAFAVARLELLRACATGDVDAGWTQYEPHIGGFLSGSIAPDLERLRQEFDSVAPARDGRACEIGEDLISRLSSRRLPGMEAIACSQTAGAYWRRLDGDRGANLERSRELLERALSIIDRDSAEGPNELRRTLLVNLGSVMGDRRRGDRAANLERAIAVQRRALPLTNRTAEPDEWALLHTNLALTLLKREAVAMSIEDSDVDVARSRRVQDVHDAVHSLRSALTVRTFERNPGDWAFTQLNLGVAMTHNEEGERHDALILAQRYFEEAVRGFSAAGDRQFQAKALGNLATAKAELADLPGCPPSERGPLLAAAEEDAREAIRRIGEDTHSIDAGGLWLRLGNVQKRTSIAIVDLERTFRRALEDLTPSTSPRESLEAAWTFAGIASDAGEWELAEHMWEIAAESADAAIRARADRNARFTELGRVINVFRWAAYGLCRTGRWLEAAEALESGRARELADWLQQDLVDLGALRDANPTLCSRYIDLRRQLDEQDRDGDTSMLHRTTSASEQLAEVVGAIRELEGFDSFLRRPSVQELLADTPAGEVIAYPLTSPWGSCWLLLEGGTERLHCVQLPGLRSTTVWNTMARMDEAAGTAEGYWFEQRVTGPLLDTEIARVAELLVPSLIEPLKEFLRHRRVRCVCLVPIGLLGGVPLHALESASRGAGGCLLDEFDVIYAPSAQARQVCRVRASRGSEFRRLLAVGNPLPSNKPLMYAEEEALRVSELICAEETEKLFGHDGTKDAVLRELPRASHTHLSCHARSTGDPWAFDSAFVLGDDVPVSAIEILSIDMSETRLVTASACETGVIPGYEAADEVLSIATVLVGAGAAGVVASLWRVDDYATALMMTRFYEELVNMPAAPARALRLASLWLRDLTGEEEERYCVRHPTLTQMRNTTTGFRPAPYGAWRQYPSLWGAFALSGA